MYTYNVYIYIYKYYIYICKPYKHMKTNNNKHRYIELMWVKQCHIKHSPNHCFISSLV